MADTNVSVSFSASTNDFVSQVSQAKDALQSFSAPFGEINAATCRRWEPLHRKRSAPTA